MILADNRHLKSNSMLVMGILNVTPDSFSDGGKFDNLDDAEKQAKRMIDEGADIIDIGGESSRPGSYAVGANIELQRTIPIIERIRSFSDIPISIDTTKAEVAAHAIEAGADIINDISALRFDEKMVHLVKEKNVPVILMHMLGQPKTMQKQPSYEDCLREIKEFFEERINFCINNGVAKSKIVIDPGIGFGKRLEDNLAILRWLHLFKEFGVPVMLGASRKSFIPMITGDNKPADRRIGGSLAAVFAAVQAECDIVRVHDVAETIEAVKVAKAIKEAG